MCFLGLIFLVMRTWVVCGVLTRIAHFEPKGGWMVGEVVFVVSRLPTLDTFDIAGNAVPQQELEGECDGNSN